jgi:hypothetical protein
MELTAALKTLVMLPFWVGALVQLSGMPVAWLRVRRSAAWAERPPALRRVPLLAAYMRPVTEVAVLCAFAVALMLVLVHSVLRPAASEVPGIVYGILLFGLPLALAPWAVARLDPSRLSALVDARRSADLADRR